MINNCCQNYTNRCGDVRYSLVPKYSTNQKGDKGNPGQSFISGDGVPSPQLGANGDTYLNLLTDDIYVKTAGVWVLETNIKGDKGDKGDNGDSTSFISFVAPIINTQVELFNTAYQDLAYFAWSQSLYGTLSSRMLVYIEITDALADIRVTDLTNSVVLGTVTGVATTGIQTIMLTNPTSDANIVIEARRDLAGIVNPIIYSAVYVATNF